MVGADAASCVARLNRRPDATIGVAWKQMRDRKIRHLPVLDAKGRLVGIVTASDMLKTFVRVLDEGIVSKAGRWRAGG